MMGVMSEVVMVHTAQNSKSQRKHKHISEIKTEYNKLVTEAE